MLRVVLPLVCALVVLVALGRPPVLDEEGYLDIGAQIAAHPLRPYDWFRPWQPWGASRPEDAYLYAHPPLHLLWVSLWQAVWGWGPALRASAALPLAGVLGLAVADLALGWCRRPALAAALWVASPVVVLALQAGLMPDLGVVAWATASVAAHRRGQEGGRGWSAAAGALLGLACGWKYPAGVLLPLLWATSPHRWTLLAAFAAVWGGLEAALWAQYGRPHLLVVLAQAPRIDHGPLEGRLWGSLARLGLALSPLALLARPRWGLGLAVGVAWFALPQMLGEGLEFDGLHRGLGWALLAAGLGLVGTLLVRGRSPGDGVLRAWALLALGVVVLGHNYAAARYLLPAVTPLALLVADAARWPRVAWAGVVLWAALAGRMSVAVQAQAEAAVAVADALVEGLPPGRFSGEWTFRWRMQAHGWRFFSPEERLAPGERLAVPTVSSPAERPAGLLPLRRAEAGEGALRLNDPRLGVGYDAETLGPLPLGWGQGPLEVGGVWEAP